METAQVLIGDELFDVNFEIESDFGIVQDTTDDVKLISVKETNSSINLYPSFLTEKEKLEIKEKCYYLWFNDLRETHEGE